MLAEAELRRAMARPAAIIPARWHSGRLTLVAQALSAIGAIDARIADEIQAGLDLGIAAGRPGQAGEISPGQPELAPEVQMRLARLIHSPPPWPATGTPRWQGPSTGQTRPALQRSPRVVPVGRAIRIQNGDARRELLVVAYVQSSGRALFTIAGWPFQPFDAVDNRGANYRIGFRGGSGAAVLVLRPGPLHEIRWLDVITMPGEPATRIDLDPPGSRFPTPDVTVTPKAASPGELLLNVAAVQALSAAAAFPQDTGRLTAARPELLASTRGLGDIVAALHAAGALSPASPVPGQLAGLCARLCITGHGITAPPAGDLPEPWQSMLTRYHRREPRAALAPGSLAAMMAGLPELDGARITILGLHHGDRGTVLHMLASGVTPEDDWAYSRGVRPLPVLWVRDSSDRWHATRINGLSLSGNTGGAVLWLAIVPPLDRSTAWIEVVAAGQSAEARVRLPLGWKQARQA